MLKKNSALTVIEILVVLSLSALFIASAIGLTMRFMPTGTYCKSIANKYGLLEAQLIQQAIWHPISSKNAFLHLTNIKDINKHPDDIGLFYLSPVSYIPYIGKFFDVGIRHRMCVVWMKNSDVQWQLVTYDQKNDKVDGHIKLGFFDDSCCCLKPVYTSKHTDSTAWIKNTKIWKLRKKDLKELIDLEQNGEISRFYLVITK